VELNEVHTEHEQATVSLKVVLLIFAIVLIGALAYLVWAANTAPDTTDNSAATKKTTTSETVDWKTYTNTTMSYSVKYPGILKVWESTGEGPLSTRVAATASARSIAIREDTKNDNVNAVFSLNGTSLSTLSVETIKTEFVYPDNLAVVSYSVGGLSGYKVTDSITTGVVSDFYFVKSSTAEVIELVVLKNSDTAALILASFKFTK